MGVAKCKRCDSLRAALRAVLDAEEVRKEMVVPDGYKRRGPKQTIQPGDLYWNGVEWKKVPKDPRHYHLVGEQQDPIIYLVKSNAV